MELKVNNTCCFIGHRKIDWTKMLEDRVKAVVENLIVKKRVDTFLFGSRSKFNDLCYEVVSEFKKKYQNIKRIYVRGEFQYIDDKYKEKYFLKYHEDSYLPNRCSVGSYASYIERNREMIDSSDICVFYYDKSYTPERQVLSNRGVSPKYSSKTSGTKLAFDYAKRKHKEIINVYM